MSCTFDFKLTSHAKIQPAFTSFWLSHHSLALVTLYVQFYALIGQNLTGEFMRKIYAAFRKVFTDSWSWQSFFCHLCDVFNSLFLLDIQNEIQLLSRSFCNLWLVCLLRFWLKNAPLVKVIGNPISYGIVFKLSLLTCPCSRRKGVE